MLTVDGLSTVPAIVFEKLLIAPPHKPLPWWCRRPGRSMVITAQLARSPSMWVPARYLIAKKDLVLIINLKKKETETIAS